MARITEHRLYGRWSNMKTRCYNSNIPDYRNWGGRGIKVCKQWQDFKNFALDMDSTFFEGATLDRIDNDKDYSPENCRWATRKEQRINQRDVNFLEFNGRKLTLADWARELNIKSSTLRQRFYVYNWSIERCLTEK